jgi:hypothetical protein
MIYFKFTTFIFTLLLAHITRAMPACGDAASPEDMYDPMYDDEQVMFATYFATWSSKYDNPNGITKSLACSEISLKYPHFHNIPNFPFIGGAFNIQEPNSPNCGHCWKLTNPKTHKSIYFTAVDYARSSGFVLSNAAYIALGETTASFQVDAVQVPPHFCKFK